MSLLAGWLFFLFMVLAVGSVGTRWGVLPRIQGLDGAERLALEASTARIGLFAALALIPAFAALLARQVGEFRFPGDPWMGATQTVLTTSWGGAWWMGVAGALAGAVGFAVAAWGQASRSGLRFGWWLATLALAVVALFPGLTGHANASAPRVLWITLDAIHVIASGVWIGGLALMLLLARRGDSGQGLLVRYVPCFSPVALSGAGLLVLTGGLAAIRELDTLSALWATGYGRLLMLKLGLVLAVAALGAFHWKRLARRLGTSAGDRAMQRSASLEFVVANLVLVVTAVLVRTSP